MTTYTTNLAQTVTIPLSSKVYLNTLAVYGVNTYLQWIQIETDLESSDSWNLGANALCDVCDLELPNIGKIICYPVLPAADSFTPPENILPDAIAYIPLRFGEVLNEVELLGYRPIINTNNVPETIPIRPCRKQSLARNYLLS